MFSLAFRRPSQTLNAMKALMPIAGAATSFISSCIALFLAGWLLELLPVGNAYFADTPIQGLTYGELIASLVIILAFAYCIGLLHGFLYGERYFLMLSLAAAAPVFIMMLALAALTLGMGLIAFPIVVAYATVIAYGAKRGGKLRPAAG
ncbi:MAG TPA: hypothetical protein VEC01_11750 [Noviherbaspirillum sp.]|uniref:hypothetical protein n=1 Tax=Noviherbaspirillum sp. TaxID=1926288 RepID=UPI002D2896B1|nr:hypothetical protein [Noviherbaspirillum sp.]HYD95992.1 hypothetical protein [Noviherbaspirillum sp.]